MADTQNVYQRLSAVQNELKVPKGQKNTFGGYSYRSAEDILEAVKPVLKKHELILTISDELEVRGDRYYIKATARVVCLDFVSSSAIPGLAEAHGYAREEETKKGMDGSQITGAASSYARKYALNGLFNIDDTKDADTDAHHKVTHQEPAKRAETPLVAKSSGTEPGGELTRAKRAIMEELAKQGEDTVFKQKEAIRKIHGKSSIDNLIEANRVADALGI